MSRVRRKRSLSELENAHDWVPIPKSSFSFPQYNWECNKCRNKVRSNTKPNIYRPIIISGNLPRRHGLNCKEYILFLVMES
jgi:hypothetical protein